MKTLAGSSEQIRLFLGARLALATVFDRDRGQSLPCRIAEIQPFASSGVMQIYVPRMSRPLTESMCLPHPLHVGFLQEEQSILKHMLN